MRITLTEKEIQILAHILDHFTDYMAHDDRPDHGLGILQRYRKIDDNRKKEIFVLAGKLIRLRRKINQKQFYEEYTKEKT
jgi:hypothetical protein